MDKLTATAIMLRLKENEILKIIAFLSSAPSTFFSICSMSSNVLGYVKGRSQVIIRPYSSRRSCLRVDDQGPSTSNAGSSANLRSSIVPETRHKTSTPAMFGNGGLACMKFLELGPVR